VTVAAIPVKTGGRVTGMLLGTIDMAGLAQKVLEIKMGQTGYAFIVQGDGLQIIHPDNEKAMKYNPLKDPNADPGRSKLPSKW